jgi:catalase
MPLPSDERIIQLSKDLLEQFDIMFGRHPGFRPAHAKGVLLTGSFKPSSEAAALTRAPHATRASTPVSVRFSDSTGIPNLPDNDPNANPRGLAIRFHLAYRVHTDIICHSTDGFPTRTGQEFLEFLRAATATTQSKASPSPMDTFMGTHPAALAFVHTPKPSPASFATEAYFGVTAMRFINAAGIARYGRYRITPSAGIEHLSEEAAKAKDANYLFDELTARLAAGRIRFDIYVQIAAEDDVVDDATVHWPAGRRLLHFGSIDLKEKASQDAQQQKDIILDPIPRVDGIEPSADPLLELRAALYLLSGRRRREAPEIRSTSGA